VTPGVGRVPTVAGTGRMGAAGLEMPQVYTPDWVTLGHELGHAANMRAGAGTESTANQAHAVFAERWSGKAGQERQHFWYQGSEEFLNITNRENPIRTDVGLELRGAHSTPQGVMLKRRWAQILHDLDSSANDTYLNGVGDAAVRYDLYNQGLVAVYKHIKNELSNDPRTPDFPALRQMAQHMDAFIKAWRAMETAHGTADEATQFAYFAGRQKALASLHNIGQVVINNDTDRYNRELLRIQTLTQDYQ
jgi:hypothetical protein